jgi:hypothetical protein
LIQVKAASPVALSKWRMQVQVESRIDDNGALRLQCLRLGRRVVKVAENLDQWYGDDYRYAKVRGRDGNVYVLRVDEAGDSWELTLFQRPRAATACPRLDPSSRADEDGGPIADKWRRSGIRLG